MIGKAGRWALHQIHFSNNWEYLFLNLVVAHHHSNLALPYLALQLFLMTHLVLFFICLILLLPLSPWPWQHISLIWTYFMEWFHSNIFTMDSLISHVPAFFEPFHPPAPLLVLLQATDLPHHCLPQLLLLEDLPVLPFKHVQFHLYHASKFIFSHCV